MIIGVVHQQQKVVDLESPTAGRDEPVAGGGEVRIDAVVGIGDEDVESDVDEGADGLQG